MKTRSHSFLVPVLSGILFMSAGQLGSSQENRKAEDAGSLKFDVVSIRPSTGARPQGLNIAPDGYEAIGFPLQTTLLIAYTPAPFFKHLDDVKGIPSWASGDKYDI